MKMTKQYFDKQLNAMLSTLQIDDKSFIVNVQRELLKGKPLSKAKYYELYEEDRDKASSVLELLGEVNKNDEITAFSGLSLTPTQYKLIVENITLHTWCAVDAILFTDWLDISSHVFSNDPIDNTEIEFAIEGDFLLWSNPYPLYISIVEDMDACNIKSSFCNHVSFWASKQTANQWLNNNPNGKIVTLEDFFESDKIGIKCC